MLTQTASPVQPRLDLETLTVGQIINSPSRQVTRDDVEVYAYLTGDTNPIHLDPLYAAQTPFGKPIAHGALVLGLAAGIAYQLGFAKSAVIFNRMEHDFKRAVFYDDEIRLQLVVKAITSQRRPIPGKKVVLEVAILNQDDRVMQECVWHILLAE